MKKNLRMIEKMHKRMAAAAVLFSVSMTFTGCGNGEVSPEQPEMAYETGVLNMGTGSEGSVIHQAGWKVSDIISNTVPGIYVAVETSKGAMVNAENLSDGTMDLALIPGDVAYDTFHGTKDSLGEKYEDLRVLGACYQEISVWAVPETVGITEVTELKGRVISSGSKASVTHLVSDDVFEVLEMDESNTEIYWDSIGASSRHLKEGTADASHAFSAVPNPAHEALANDMETVFLSYDTNTLEQITQMNPWYFKTEVPSLTYANQERDIPTFGRKVLLCADADMDEDLAYEIARALDLNGPVYTADTVFMSKLAEKDFLCSELPVPLHAGAENYYLELGYLKE